MTTRTKRILALLIVAGLFVGAGVLARRRIKRVLVGVDPSSMLSVSRGPRVAEPLEVGLMIYDKKLTSGWDDWGWGQHQLGDGPAKIKFADYGGWLLHYSEVPWRYGGVSFRFKAPPSFGSFLLLQLRQAGQPEDAFPIVYVEAHHIASVEGWQEVLVDATELNPKGMPFDRLLIGARAKVGPEWVELDRVMLTKVTGQAKGALRVLCQGETQPISELIYGTASQDWGSGQTAQRLGGNPLTRANWELGAWNTGADWYFENGSTEPLLQTIDAAAQNRRKLAVVVPTIGWVAKDKVSVGFPRAKFGPQRQYDPHRPEAGDGFAPDGSKIRPGDPSETSVPAPPELIGSWIRKSLAQVQPRGFRSAQMYILDNEPTLWNVTHRDVHPDPLGYDELLDRTIKYATAIRDADPDAVIAGPAEWGFTGYQYSAIDREAGFAEHPDRRAHDDIPLVAWYLKKLAEHERATGKRLLDVLDLHFYPAANGLYGGNAGTDPVKAALRVRSTRALWDPNYVDESWINDKLRLIPRMKDWVRENYPGRKLSLGEWSFGAPEHISGGVATAEALGRFGQQGLYSAFHWGELKQGTPIYWAFRAFRDFDGHGSRFGDISVPTREMPDVSLFASRDPDASRLVLVLVNRDPETQTPARVELDGCGSVTSTRLFSYTEKSNGLAAGPSELKEGALHATLEPFSFTVIEVKLDKSNPNAAASGDARDKTNNEKH